MSERHHNTPTNRPPAISMSRQGRKSDRAEIELLTRDFLAEGGEIEELPSDGVKSHFRPAWTHYSAVPGEDEG